MNDLADAHILGLDYLMKENKSDIFNLGNGQGFTVKEVIERARVITGKNIIAKEVERRAGDPDMLVGSSKKIIDTLGWKPKFDNIDTIIKTAWDWHKKLNQGKI